MHTVALYAASHPATHCSPPQVSLTGVDRPGLLYRLSDVLASHGLNIDHLQTEQHRTRGSANQIFTTHCHVCGNVSPDVKKLKSALKQLESDLGVRCSLELTESRLHRTMTG